MFSVILLLFVGLTVALSYLVYKSYLSYRANHILSLSKNLKRNYVGLILGDSAITPNPGDNEISYANYYRNIYTDKLMLERYYSLVKAGGCVKLYIDLHKSVYHETRKVSTFDYQYLHPVTLLEEGIDLNFVGSNKVKLINLIKYIFTCLGRYKKKVCFSAMKIDQSNNFYCTIKEMDEFCKKRGLELKIFVAN